MVAEPTCLRAQGRPDHGADAADPGVEERTVSWSPGMGAG